MRFESVLKKNVEENMIRTIVMHVVQLIIVKNLLIDIVFKLYNSNHVGAKKKM